MDWDAIGAIAESLGAIGVLFTLFYLSLQIRHNAEQTRINTIENFMTREVQGREQIVDGEIPRIIDALSTGRELTSTDERRLQYYLQAYVQSWEAAYYLKERGVLPQDVYESIEFRRLVTLKTASVRNNFWLGNKNGYTPSFVKYAESILVDKGIVPPQGSAVDRNTTIGKV